MIGAIVIIYLAVVSFIFLGETRAVVLLGLAGLSLTLNALSQLWQGSRYGGKA